MVDRSMKQSDERAFNRVFGVVLLLGAAGSAFFMANHPTDMNELTRIEAIVHGAMLIMLLLLASGFSHFAWVLGLQNSLVLIGLISYLASSVFNALAAVINGFVVPALAKSNNNGISHEVLDLTWITNQVLANLAVIATGLGYCLWSAQLTLERRFWSATAGFIAGLSPLLLLARGGGAMHVETAVVVYITQVLWAAIVGIVIYQNSSR